MPKIHVVDVPEFAGLLSSARAQDGVSVTTAQRGYFTISSDTELRFDRTECGFKPALWYSCLSGGIDGEIVEYGRDILRIVDQKK